MVRTSHHNLGAKYTKTDAGEGTIHGVTYNAIHRKDKRHRTIAAGGPVCNATCRWGDGSCLICCQRVDGSVRAVRAVRVTRVFMTETRFTTDELQASLNVRYKKYHHQEE